MQRRHFIAHATASAAATALTSVAAPAWAKPASAQVFANNLTQQPLLSPFKGVDDHTGDLDCAALLLRGRWPTELRGRFYRNGPAVMQRGDERYHHWFDGDGMVQQFTLGNGSISHKGRLVRTSKLQAEQQAGRFLFSALGTHIEGRATGSGPDAFNTANTNALEHAGRVLAMWEGGSAYAMSPKDLSTQGPVTWRKDLQQMPFSAHPKVDASGNLWNIGTAGKHLIAWHINPQGELSKVQIGESPYPGGMVHDMAITPRYLVVPLPPVTLNFEHSVGDGPRRFALKAGEPLRVLVMDKNDIQKRRVFEVPAQMLFHVGNAHEEPNGDVVLSFVGGPDAWFLDRGAVALMAGLQEKASRSNLQVMRMNMQTGRASVQALPGEIEFPRMDPRRIGLPARWLVSGVSWKHFAGRTNSLLHGVQVLDVQTGRAQQFDYGEHLVAEEHIVIPKPGKTGELDAWLLGTTFDARRQATVLNLLDAAHVADGPIAQAVLPYTLPLGFHGNFTAA
jgi:all-trans-8'-apo-beta-carotenal 15,15'-oxygenase